MAGFSGGRMTVAHRTLPSKTPDRWTVGRAVEGQLHGCAELAITCPGGRVDAPLINSAEREVEQAGQVVRSRLVGEVAGEGFSGESSSSGRPQQQCETVDRRHAQ
jgi:hypothetical protein